MSNLNLNDFIDEDKEFDGRSSVIAAVLCLFLGMFGIHSFYVGRSKSGTIRFLLGIICVVCALLHVKVGFLIFLIAFFLFFVDLVYF